MQADPFSTILITGGTGTWGQAATRFLLEHTTATIRIYSRSELLHAQMRQTFAAEFSKEELSRVRYLLGDIRDLPRLEIAMQDVDCCFHAAALKHVDMGEYNPNEFVATNVIGTDNVMRACMRCGVGKAVLLSSDKAVWPLNLYGSSKMVSEKLWVRGNSYSVDSTSFVAVRYGNVSRSRGSVIPIWEECLRNNQPLPVTDLAMTRFFLDREEAVETAWFAAQYAPQGAIIVPHLPAYAAGDLLTAVATYHGKPVPPTINIGVRAGEKLHERLMTFDEEERCIGFFGAFGNYPIYYAVPPVEPSWYVPGYSKWLSPSDRIQPWRLSHLQEHYESSTWSDRMTIDMLASRIK